MVVGDFNIEEASDKFFNALQDFQMPLQMDNLCTNFSRTATYDKIAWVERKGFDFSGNCNVIPFGKVLFQDVHPKGGEAQISDHLPLWCEFRVNKLTQELSQILNP